MPANRANNKTDKIVKGISWLLLLSWFNRLLGFASIFILARILTPEDFGVMALVMIAIQLTDTLTNVGAEQYYIQKKQATQDDLNSAWSLNLAIKLFASLVFLILSPIVAASLGYQHLTQAFVVVAFLPVINALSNGFIFAQKKALNFRSFSLISASAKVFSTLVTIALALTLKSYWALIAGALLQALIFTILSYVYLNERAALSLANWKEPFHFSKWIMLKSIVGHIRAKFDIWFAVNIQGMGGLGGYNLAKDVTLLPSREFLSPVSDVMFTAIAQAENHSENQQQQISKALTVLFILASPIAFGWALIAEPFVALILGPQWQPYTATIAALGYLVVTFAIGNFISQLMVATGKVKSLFFYDVFTLAVAFGILYLFSSNITSVSELADYRVIIGIIILVIGMCWLAKLQIAPLTSFVKAMMAPFLGAAIMVWVTKSVLDTTQTSVMALLSILIVAGFSYLVVISIAIALKLFGKPETAFLVGLLTQAKEKILK